MSPEEAAILSLIAASKKGRTIDPTEVARAVYTGEDPDGWRKRLPSVRQAAIHLARSGQISIYRKGKVIDPNGFKGVYRLGVPGEIANPVSPDDELEDASGVAE
ncbi:DUF3253 domain-containing protein [Aquidulcibacter sp.]|uniref:DUF3253 domain-containing protein n=1 Tax=Aquidulcibacter sp. TaxID=2052990 RepID=UPI0025C16CAE|nr:DUF3253 domain-containing protein [Aquidulcibacter sp.]MCA3694416.1 DUF3253 domain-containing protein [Aquidulcibacter sp.]